MSEVTRILSAIEQGDPRAAEQLLPLVYEGLRKPAAQRQAQEKPGQTLQATSLVHEGYLRLVDVEQPQAWNGRGHFFAAAAEAMRRIEVESARRKPMHKDGGGRQRRDPDADALIAPESNVNLLALDAALHRLAEQDPIKATIGAVTRGEGDPQSLRQTDGRERSIRQPYRWTDFRARRRHGSFEGTAEVSASPEKGSIQ
jgi:RNA polymerase sigma factor (TIGR02999 family)